MASYNKIQLTGKLNDAPDVKATTSGHSLSKFTLVVPRIEALPNQRFDYIRVTAWRENADKTTNYQKGDILFVEGRILTDSYEDASTGQRKWTTEVEARQLVNFNDVFSDAQPSTSAPILLMYLLPLPQMMPLHPHHQNLLKTSLIPPVDESLFFNQSSTSDESENELEEAVPF